MYVCRCEPCGGGVLVSDSLPLHQGRVLRGDGAGARPQIVPHRVRVPLHTYIYSYNNVCMYVCMCIRCGFRLPGEAQKIDRFVEVFVKTFWQVCMYCMYVLYVCMYGVDPNLTLLVHRITVALRSVHSDNNSRYDLKTIHYTNCFEE